MENYAVVKAKDGPTKESEYVPAFCFFKLSLSANHILHRHAGINLNFIHIWQTHGVNGCTIFVGIKCNFVIELTPYFKMEMIFFFLRKITK